MWSPLHVTDFLAVDQTGGSQGSHPPARAKLCPPHRPAGLHGALAGLRLLVLCPDLFFSILQPTQSLHAQRSFHHGSHSCSLQPSLSALPTETKMGTLDSGRPGTKSRCGHSLA